MELKVQPLSPKKSPTKSPKRLLPPPLAARVKVAVRVRPPVVSDGDEPLPVCIAKLDPERESTGSENSIKFQLDKMQKSFRFDHVFSSEAAQTDVYIAALQPLLASLMHGFNVTVLAYGQTGSGKTYTMGGAETSTSQCGSDDGLIPRFVRDLFDALRTEASLETTAQVSFLEIYCDEIRDLLVDERTRSLSLDSSRQSAAPKLTIHEDDCDVWVEGLQQVKVTSVDEALALLKSGRQRQTTGAHALNDQSSRSHAVYTLEISRSFASEFKHAKLTFVDLAGSERVKKTLLEGQGMKEGSHINIGLLALGNVINALGSRQRRLKRRNSTGVTSRLSIISNSEDTASPGPAHVPYRSSKLTRLLRDALGGNSVTLFIACISPEMTNGNETLNTLQYANRARSIQNQAQKNVEETVTEIEIADEAFVVQATESEREIYALRDQVAALKMQLDQAVAAAKAEEVRDSSLANHLPKVTRRSQGKRRGRVAALKLDLTENDGNLSPRLECEQCEGVTKKNTGQHKEDAFATCWNPTSNRKIQCTPVPRTAYGPELPITNEDPGTIQTGNETFQLVPVMVNQSTQYEPPRLQSQRKTPVDYVLLTPSQIYREVHNQRRKELGAHSLWSHRRRLDIPHHELPCSDTLLAVTTNNTPNSTTASCSKTQDVLQELLRRTRLLIGNSSQLWGENKPEIDSPDQKEGQQLSFETFVDTMATLYDQQSRQLQYVRRLTQRVRHLANFLVVANVDTELIEFGKYMLGYQQDALQNRLDAFERLAADRLWTRLQHREIAIETGIWNDQLAEIFLSEEQYEACTSWHAHREDHEFFQQRILPFILNGWISVTPSDLENEQLWLTL